MPALPKWKNIELKEAARIKRIDCTNDPETGHRIYRLQLDVPCSDQPVPVDVGSQFMRKHDPHAGGFYVRYPDGYESFCPKESFLRGHKPVGE